MLVDYDWPSLLTDFPVHNIKPGERVVSARSITSYGEPLDALTSPFTFLSLTSKYVFIPRSILICIKIKVTKNLAIKENHQLLLKYLDDSRPHSLPFANCSATLVFSLSYLVMANRSLNHQYLHQCLGWSKLNRVRFVIMISFTFSLSTM